MLTNRPLRSAQWEQGWTQGWKQWKNGNRKLKHAWTIALPTQDQGQRRARLRRTLLLALRLLTHLVQCRRAPPTSTIRKRCAPPCQSGSSLQVMTRWWMRGRNSGRTRAREARVALIVIISHAACFPRRQKRTPGQHRRLHQCHLERGQLSWARQRQLPV